MVRYLTVMYEPAFGRLGRVILLAGALAVLYSTLFVGIASLTRKLDDWFVQMHLGTEDSAPLRRRVLAASIAVGAFAMMLGGWEPRALLLFSGFVQNLFFILVGVAVLYVRFCRLDVGLRPSRAWDVVLVVSVVVVGLLAALNGALRFAS